MQGTSNGTEQSFVLFKEVSAFQRCPLIEVHCIARIVPKVCTYLCAYAILLQHFPVAVCMRRMLVFITLSFPLGGAV